MPAAIVGLIASFGVPGLVTAAGTLTAIGSVVAGAIGLGLSYGINALLGQTDGPKPVDVKTVLRQSLPTRKKYRGLVRTGGVLAFIETDRGSLHMIVYFGEGPCSEILEWYVDERVVTLNEDGFIEAAPYNSKVRIEFRMGAVPSTHYATLASAFSDIWGEDYRGDGWISAYVTQFGVKAEKFTSVYPNRICVVNSVRRDGAAYDPRTGLTTWTANLPLMLRDFMIDSDGMQIDPTYIDDDDIAAAADIGDEIIVTSGGGTVRRYHGQLAFDMSSEPGDAINRLLVATDGRLYLKPSGKIGYLAGAWIEPTVFLPDTSILSYDISDGGGPLREANEVKVNYTNPLAKYSEASCDPWRDEDDISLSGGVKAISIDAYEIHEHHHARRVAKLRSRRAAPRWQGSITYDLCGMKAWDQRFIRCELLDLDIDFESFEVESAQLADDGMSVTYELISFDDEAYALPFEEEGVAPAVVEDVSEDTLNPPENLIVTAGQRNVSGGQQVATLNAQWDADPDRSDLDGQAQYALADSDSWLDMAVADDDLSAEVIGLADGQIYDVRVRWLAPGGTPSNWTLDENTVVTADPVAPLALSNFQFSDAAPRLGRASFTISTQNDARIRYVSIYKVASGASFDPDTATLLTTLVVASLSTYAYTYGDATRTNLISVSGFASDTVWTKGTGWTIGSGVATHAAGTQSDLSQAVSMTAAIDYRYGITVTARTAGSVAPKIVGSTTVFGSSISTVGSYFGKITSPASPVTLALQAGAAFAGSVDDILMFAETPNCGDQGLWDFYAVPRNGSLVPGPHAGPLTATII